MKAQGVPSRGLPWNAPTTRLGRLLPALRDDLHRRYTPLVLGEGGTNPPATRFPRGSYPPRLVRPRPSLDRASRPKTTTVDHSVPSPQRPVVLDGAPPPSCGALRIAPERSLLTKTFSPRQGRDTPTWDVGSERVHDFIKDPNPSVCQRRWNIC